MMFEDKYMGSIKEADIMNIRNLEEERFVPKFIGEVQDKIIFLKDGIHRISEGFEVEAGAGEELLLPVGYNVVVDNASKLIAALMKRHAGYSGALYWEVGTGSEAWSNTSPPNPAKTDTALLTPLFRKDIQTTDISFIDGSNNVTASVTNRIQIVVKFLSNEANGSLREFGIFGGNATSALGSGLMINRKTHGLIYKTSAMELERTLRFTF